jgi:multidrug efflux pump
MNPSRIFIERPVATTLLTAGVVMAGVLAFRLLPVAPLPSVDIPTISVSAQLPGASPETMAATVATPLERALGQIANVTEMTSSSSLGQTRITLQFELSRDIDGAARDVQAAINNARSLLPSGMPSNPQYRKVNPADAPIIILSLTSETLTRGQLYDVADTVLSQKLAQIQGVGQVEIGGASQPAVRVELNPPLLDRAGISTEQVRAAITGTNANRPKGFIESGDRHWQIGANDQAKSAREYRPIVIAYRDGAAVRLGDVAEVNDSVKDVRNAGLADGKPAVLLILTRQPNANIIETVDRVKAALPQLRAEMPAAIDLRVMLDRTLTIRTSLREVERTLIIAVVLVIMVVFIFLRRASAALIPAVAVPVSLIGTFGVMYLAGFSLDNLSLMALTIATGFVVDDAVVVLENITRHVEAGKSVREAALTGAREVGFTVLSMSLSLVAVFIPILLMGGIVGRLFREFAMTLSIAILISLVVSLSATAMMCAHVLKPAGAPPPRPGRWQRAGDAAGRAFDAALGAYRRSLAWAMAHGRTMMLILLGAVFLNVWLYTKIDKTFFPQQDTGRIGGNIQGDQAISFEAMQQKLIDFMRIVRADPAVDTVAGFIGGGGSNSGRMFMMLKPRPQRTETSDQVIARLRKKLSREPGATLYLQAAQDVGIGGRMGNAQFQYTVQADDLDELRAWEPRVRLAMSKLPELTDVNTDAQDRGSSTYITVDKDAAARLGVTQAAIDTTLNNLFGQRQVSTIYNPLNQYRVVMEAAPDFLASPDSLRSVYVTGTAADGTASVVPLAAIAHVESQRTALSVNHQGPFAASTISFGLAEGVALSQATAAIGEAMNRLNLPTSVHGGFQGTAKAFQESLDSQPLLILAALVAVYIVLGILYESYMHPLTILSTLPSAGVGALLALMATDTEFSIIALIGVILLIGIVKKNAIMMVDFAIESQRAHGTAPEDAIVDACVHRFRPIMMTTMAALFGALPLALGSGDGAELRHPLGISIAGGLIVSQLLTLYTTPLVYVYLDRFQSRLRARRRARRQRREALSAPLQPESGT